MCYPFSFMTFQKNSEYIKTTHTKNHRQRKVHWHNLAYWPFSNIFGNISSCFGSQLLSTFYTSPVFIHTIIAVKSVANTTLRNHIGGIPFIIFFASNAYELNILRHLSTSPINVFMLNQEFTHLLFDNSDSDEQQRNILK
jgi:hypothetical protein